MVNTQIINQKLLEIERKKALLEIERVKLLAAEWLVEYFSSDELTAIRATETIDIDNGKKLLVRLRSEKFDESEITIMSGFIDRIAEIKRTMPR